MLPNMLRFVPTLAGVVLSLLLLTPRLGHDENTGSACQTPGASNFLTSYRRC